MKATVVRPWQAPMRGPLLDVMGDATDRGDLKPVIVLGFITATSTDWDPAAVDRLDQVSADARARLALLAGHAAVHDPYEMTAIDGQAVRLLEVLAACGGVPVVGWDDPWAAARAARAAARCVAVRWSVLVDQRMIRAAWS